MTEAYKYVVVGRGRWAPRIKSILAAEGRNVCSLENARRANHENESTYYSRLTTLFRSSAAQIAWLCLPPGEHLPFLISVAIESGLHVIVEKPWLCSQAQTAHLEALAKSHGARLAVHYEYCLMEAVEAWRRNYKGGADLRFAGRLNVARPNHIGLPALENLGSHLFSIHEYSVPHSTIEEIGCAYEQPDERRVWLKNQNRPIAEIDLLANKEPIIQRFFARVESAIRGGEFPFDLQFGLRVAQRTAAWRRLHPQDLP